MNRIVIFLLIYCIVGIGLFMLALNLLGGIENYKEEIKRENPRSNPNVLIFFATIIFMTTWPYYLIKSFFERKEEKKDE